MNPFQVVLTSIGTAVITIAETEGKQILSDLAVSADRFAVEELIKMLPEQDRCLLFAALKNTYPDEY